MIEIAIVSDVASLDTVIDLIHDEWFDLDSVVWDRHTSVVEIPFSKEMYDDREVLSGALLKKIRIPTVKCRLKISHVEDCTIVDTECVGSYDMTSVEYDAQSRGMRITTGVPLDFSLRVSELYLQIFREETPTNHRIINAILA